MSREETMAVIKSYVDKIVRDFQPEKIILFGSWAWGTPNKDSDADLLIVKNTSDTRVTRREIDGALFPREIPLDLVVYNADRLTERASAGDSFLRKILTEGVVLYAS